MTTTAPRDSSNRVFLFVVAGIVVVGLFGIALLATNRDGGSTSEQTAEAEITGDSLVPMPAELQVTDITTDPAGGTQAPTVVGSTFDGDEVTIGADGRPKVVYFLAHWCPHCQEEVPVVQELIDSGQAPDGVDIYAVSTAVDVGRGNYPPETWLEREDFTPPTIRDDAQSSIFQAYGGSGFPYVVYLDGDNRVVARSAGNLPADAILSLWASTAG